jgi:RNA-directed DNA polymerase
MKQLELFKDVKEKEVQLRKRLATTLIPNSIYGEATNRMKLEEGSCWAATKVKVLSPEIIVSEAQAVHFVKGNMLTTAKGEGVSTLAGSKAVARQQKDSVGTREAQGIPQRNIGVCDTKPIDGKVLQMMLWESDQPILVKKQGNACGAKGLAVMSWEGRDTSSTLRGGQRKSTKLSSLSVRAQEDSHLKFTSLAHLLTVDFLEECFRELKRNKASGVDGVTVRQYEENLEENLKYLVERLKAKRYRPQPVRRVYIPKPKGGKRPLGIPTVEDKVVQMALKKILEAILEVDFLDVSFGFRPARSCHQALDVLDKTVMTKPVNYIVDMDIEKFFDIVDHKWLMKFLKVRISDPNILRLVERFLRTGVMEEGKYYEIDKGTPQGGILSPLLANIYLHFCLDIWFEKVIKKKNKRFCMLIRYADDFVVCFQFATEAVAFGKALKERLGKFGLKISKEKSQIIPFGRYPWLSAQKKGKKLKTFDFLGFTHYCTKTRRGYFRLGRKTSKLKFRQKIKELNQWLKRVRNMVELKEWWKVLKLKFVGHFRYYGISGNAIQIGAFYRLVLKLAFKWINRRSQRKSYNWAQFNRYLKYNPLPKPRIYHLTYTLSSKRGCIAEEPCEGKLHARFCEGH